MVTPERSTFIKIMPRDKIIANIDRDSHQIIADYHSFARYLSAWK